MKIKRTQDYIAVHGDFKVLSSAIYNGGFVSAKAILNVNADKDSNGNAFVLFDSLFKEIGLASKETVGLMTAVPMKNARIIEKGDMTAIITAGISKSTVNIILLIDKNLTPSAMVNVIIVATEAKTAAFYDLDVHDEKGDLFTGDYTDSTALELYVPVEGEEGDRAELKKRLEETIKVECSDINIALLLAAALHSEEEEINKGRAGEAGETDAACIVADELIGLDIAEYIGGKKAIFNFIYYDTRKPGILGRLGVFMDDAIGGLIAGCMTEMLG